MKCDIIIPVWNEKFLTSKCIDSIRKNTHIPYRILIIDNDSDPETSQYLKKLTNESPDSISLKRNDKNLGFPKAVNQGIALSSAPYLCILNSDTEVYDGWLTEMVRVAESSADIGIVNPASNNLGRKYTQPASKDYGKYIEMSACIGFSMLIKREVVDKIGKLDEIYSPGNFEDTDFSRRAIKADFRCVMAEASYVYHVQNTGFKKRKDWDERFKRNLNIFNERWGKVKRIAYIIKDIKENDLSAAERNIRDFLKNGDWVYVFLKKGCIRPDLKEHCSLRVFELGSFIFDIKVFWRVVTRKKKFDKVVTLR
ncbi:glycosyltransferase family 2 protein [Candidatus Omnitrophota bacterium]